MAVNPITPLVSVDEYLNSSYHPDLEYVDGFLVEHGMPTIAHGLLQTMLGAHFHFHSREFRYAALTETRTQIIERARYRFPDLMLCPLPLPRGKIVNVAPWAVIEILSPEDRLPDQLQRFREYKQIGVRHMILLDPEELLAFRFEDGSLLQSHFTALDLPTGSIPFDTDALFRQLTEKRNEGAE
jgi:Uma2 family endonuclease